MNPLLIRLLPWAIGVLAIGSLVFAFAQHEQHKGESRAHSQVAEWLQQEYDADTAAYNRGRAVRQKEVDELKRKVIVADTKQRLAAQKADSLTSELAAQLPVELKPKLDAIQAAHAVERAQWAVKETQYNARLSIMQSDSAETAARVTALNRVNHELRASLGAGNPRPSFGAKVVKVLIPAVVGAATTLVLTH
jgi:hypothetical protein